MRKAISSGWGLACIRSIHEKTIYDLPHDDVCGRKDSLHISWIVCGETHIDLHKAVEILYTEFGVERMAVVGGGTINAAFLNAGLLDEVSILLGPGIDGRKGMTATFDGLPLNTEPVNLKLLSVQPYDNGAVWLRYALH